MRSHIAEIQTCLNKAIIIVCQPLGDSRIDSFSIGDLLAAKCVGGCVLGGFMGGLDACDETGGCAEEWGEGDGPGGDSWCPVLGDGDGDGGYEAYKAADDSARCTEHRCFCE
jgi:hypothetical protein